MLAWYYFVLISSVLMGVSTIIEKNTLKNEHAAAYSAAFTIIILPLSLIFLPFANFHITLYEVAVIYIVSLISTSTYILSARAYRHGDISITSPLLSSVPVMFTVLFAFLFIGERLSVIQYASIVVLIVSSYFMVFDTGKDVRGGYNKGKYTAIILFDSMLMASGTVIMKYLFDLNVNIFTYLILVEYFIAFNMVLLMLFRYDGLREIASNIKRYKAPILAIAVLTTLYRVTYYLAAAPAAIGLVYTLRNSVYVLITVAIGGILFSEKKLASKTLLSAIIIIAAYVLVS